MAEKFYELSVEDRLGRLREETGASEDDLAGLGRADALDLELADRLAENVIGTLALPLGVARHFLIDGEERSVPMATEEPSVIAAASHGAKLLKRGGGIETEADPSRMRGQILVMGVRGFEAAAQRVVEARDELLKTANDRHPRLKAAGGGATGFRMRTLDARQDGWMIVFELEVDACDAMGANTVNSMCEGIAPRLAELLGGRVGMRILTNLCDQRLVRARGRVPADALGGFHGVRGLVEASRFAELDPYRACTHNKGVMNGVDAVLLATGQDFRAAEAGAHAYAGRDEGYRPLCIWRKDENGDLRGEVELPLAVGTVGSRAKVHPAVVSSLKLLGVTRAHELARIAAAVGLAQNLAALRALSQEGIQQGHMALHRRVEA